MTLSTKRPQPVSWYLTSRGLTATQPHLEEGGIVAETTLPETDPYRLVAVQCECCGKSLTKRAGDPNRKHVACWEEHHSDPGGPWPPGHQCRIPRSDD